MKEEILNFLTSNGKNLDDYILYDLGEGEYSAVYMKNGFVGDVIFENDLEYDEMIKILIENGNKILAEGDE